MNSEQVRAFYAENFYYILLVGVGIGLLFGAIPLILGIRRNKRTLGVVALVVTGIFGAISPVLSIFTAAVFTFLVLRRTVDVVAADESTSG